MEPLSRLAYIDAPPVNPVTLFSELLQTSQDCYPDQKFTSMNLATVDSEFGVLNRYVVYRGLTDGHITFITEKNSRKYSNLMANPKVSLTILLAMMNFRGVDSNWQIRVFGEAVELSPGQITHYYNEDPVFAKIRSRICECGKPVNYTDLKKDHDTLLKAYKSGQDSLPQTETYTGFKIIPTVWDFYKGEPNACIADRVQYRKDKSGGDTWNIMHVAA